MTLISLLLVVVLERLTTKSDLWRSETYLLPYIEGLKSNGWLYEYGKAWQVYLAVVVPPLVCWAVYQWLESSFLTLLLNLVLLFIAVGCPHIRAKYKGYLQAANRGDNPARHLYAEQLNYDPEEGCSFGQHMIWLNFRYYFAIPVWFLILGGTGAVLYLTARFIESQATNDYGRQVANRIMTVLDWIPVRLAAIGFLLVGHFSKGIKVFSGYAFDLSTSAKTLVQDVAKASEDIEAGCDDYTEEPSALLKLAKRNMMFLLTATAVLTLGGWLN